MTSILKTEASFSRKEIAPVPRSLSSHLLQGMREREKELGTHIGLTYSVYSGVSRIMEDPSVSRFTDMMMHS